MPRNTDPLLSLPDSAGVLYVRLYQYLRALILQGRWSPGTRLPSTRQLAADLGISRNTASMAIDQLLADGWIETRSRSGTFVTDAVPLVAGSTPSGKRDSEGVHRFPVPFELSPGALDLFPFARWAKLQAQVWARRSVDLLYQTDSAGDPGLRRAIADVVGPVRGFSASPDNVIIVTSTLSAYDLIAAALGPGGTVVVEDPGYIFADAVFAKRGLKVVPVPVDEHGLDVEAGRRLAPEPALIVTSVTQFPMGIAMSTTRREQLQSWAADTGAWIIVDDYDGTARFDGPPRLAGLGEFHDTERVIHVSSFSRVLFRSLRLGFMTVPPTLRRSVIAAREAVEGFVTLPDQLVLREFIERGLLSAHQRLSREAHQPRRDALLELLEPYRGTLFEAGVNPRGLHIVARPRGVPSEAIASALRQSGITCTTLAQLSRATSAPDAILFGFAAFPPEVIAAMRPAIDRALEPLVVLAAEDRRRAGR